MKINKLKNKPNFTSSQMSPLSKGLYILSNNDMLKAAGVDFFCTDTQRTMLEFKNRGKNAGIEMGFREYTGTFIVEFSSALFAYLTSKILSKHYKPEIKINPSSWATNNTLDVLNNIYQNSGKSAESFVKNTFNSISGTVGSVKKDFSSVSDEKMQSLIKNTVNLITNQNLNKKEIKRNLADIQTQAINTLGADNEIFVKSGDKEIVSNMTHVLRDIVDTGRNIFFKEGLDVNSAISKLKTLNKSRTMIAIPLAMLLAVSNQYINRRLTKARTGIDNFVGENGYEDNVKNKNEQTNQKGLWAKKLLSAGIFLAMLFKVMKVKKPSDIINKLEFDGPATSGSAIKTIYGTLITGRILASKDTTELRETNTRDYLGFLNWLVLGDFVAKGVGQILDKNQENLFNISKEGKGIKHWLNDVSLKSQKEIIASGKNVRKNLAKLNIAQISGILYSALMLGFLLPKLNIWLTKRRGGEENKNQISEPIFKGISMNDFMRNTRTK